MAQAAESLFKPGDKVLDYQITALLERGGMGEVYEAKGELAGEEVAIKCLQRRLTSRPDLMLRLTEECKIYGQLRHPNIVRMYRAGLTREGILCIVMERLVGRTLAQLLRQARRLDLIASLDIMIQTASAMCFAHRKGIWHRDLKPGNLMTGTPETRGALELPPAPEAW